MIRAGQKGRPVVEPQSSVRLLRDCGPEWGERIWTFEEVFGSGAKSQRVLTDYIIEAPEDLHLGKTIPE